MSKYCSKTMCTHSKSLKNKGYVYYCLTKGLGWVLTYLLILPGEQQNSRVSIYPFFSPCHSFVLAFLTFWHSYFGTRTSTFGSTCNSQYYNLLLVTLTASTCPLLAATIRGDHPFLDCLLTANWIWPECSPARIAFSTSTLPSWAQ